MQAGHRDLRVAGLLARQVRGAGGARTWRELLFCLIEVPLGLSALLLAGLPLLVLLAGHLLRPVTRPGHGQPPGGPPFPAAGALLMLAVLALLAPRVARGLAAVHRRLAGTLLGERIAGPPPACRGRGAGRWLAVTLRDAHGWRAAAYLLAKLPVTAAECYPPFLAAAGLANLTYPLWWPLLRNHPPGARLAPVPALTPFGALPVASVSGTFAAAAAGAAMVLAAPWLARAVTAADCWLMRAFLGPGRQAQRIADLEQTRALAVAGSAALLRQVERDLHDGAQIRLATLAMHLGMAREKLGADGEAPDLAAARELVGSAHRGASEALGELRKLVRGIHPPALDSGLADALATLAGSSAIPVRLSTSIPQRPAPAIETIAYFCAAELLANAAKHSGAAAVGISVTGRRGRLLLTVTDDGTGGADPAAGSGLAGLSQRVSTVDGRLAISSPAGGPTRITVELPLRV